MENAKDQQYKYGYSPTGHYTNGSGISDLFGNTGNQNQYSQPLGIGQYYSQPNKTDAHIKSLVRQVLAEDRAVESLMQTVAETKKAIENNPLTGAKLAANAVNAYRARTLALLKDIDNAEQAYVACGNRNAHGKTPAELADMRIAQRMALLDLDKAEMQLSKHTAANPALVVMLGESA